jgi:hypothetical protein
VKTWARPSTALPFCLVERRGRSYVSACNGRFEVAVERCEEPPYEERCKGCCPLEAAKERLRTGPFQARYPEDVQRAKERGVVESDPPTGGSEP